MTSVWESDPLWAVSPDDRETFTDLLPQGRGAEVVFQYFCPVSGREVLKKGVSVGVCSVGVWSGVMLVETRPGFAIPVEDDQVVRKTAPAAAITFAALAEKVSGVEPDWSAAAQTAARWADDADRHRGLASAHFNDTRTWVSLGGGVIAPLAYAVHGLSLPEFHRVAESLKARATQVRVRRAAERALAEDRKPAAEAAVMAMVAKLGLRSPRDLTIYRLPPGSAEASKPEFPPPPKKKAPPAVVEFVPPPPPKKKTR